MTEKSLNRIERLSFRLRILFITIILMTAMGVNAQQPAMVVLSPEPGDIVLPGSVLEVEVDVNSEFSHADVFVSILNGFLPVTLKLNSAAQSETIYSGALELPNDVDGELSLIIELYDRETGEYLENAEGVEVGLTAVPGGVPEKLLGRRRLYLEYPDSLNDDLNSGVSLSGYYPNGESYRLSYDYLGVNYVVRDTGVVSVEASGRVRSKNLGHTLVRADYSGLSWYTHITVVPDREIAGGIDDGSPPVNVTQKLKIEQSGFRYDPTTMLYVQTVNITNNDLWPILKPVVVISDLTESVTVGSHDATRVVEPLGSDVIPHVYFLGESTRDILALMPGETATLKLEFFNIKGVPIDYQLRVFEENGGV